MVEAFLAGVIAGLRSMTAPAAVSWAAHSGAIDVRDTWLHFLGAKATPYILTACAAAELVVDKLPGTPSRKAPPSFAARLASGALCGGALGAAEGNMIAGMGAGLLGAVAGTLGGYEVRTRLARANGNHDLPIALLEDALAVGGAILIIYESQP